MNKIRLYKLKVEQNKAENFILCFVSHICSGKHRLRSIYYDVKKHQLRKCEHLPYINGAPFHSIFCIFRFYFIFYYFSVRKKYFFMLNSCVGGRKQYLLFWKKEFMENIQKTLYRLHYFCFVRHSWKIFRSFPRFFGNFTGKVQEFQRFAGLITWCTINLGAQIIKAQQ